MRLTRRLAPAMSKREKGGYIINISSVAGLDAMPGMGGYNAAKFGFTGWAKSTQQVDHFTHDSKNCYLSQELRCCCTTDLQKLAGLPVIWSAALLFEEVLCRFLTASLTHSVC